MTAINISNLIMCAGFLLSLFACIQNDVIQTMGTFLMINKDRPVWHAWLYISFVIVLTFSIGWAVNGGDMAFGRLTRVPHPAEFYWWHILPPIALMCLTRRGIPAATSFLIVSIFSSNQVTGLMVAKSAIGYSSAFIVSLILYFFIARRVEKIFLYTKNRPVSVGWVIAKWISTAFLICAWLMQDGAVLYVFLPRHLELWQMILSLCALITILYFICSRRGGDLAGIIKLKTNTQDIRSATIIDIIYGSVLIYFMFVNNIPMSTTWVFLGILAGREIALYNRLRYITEKKVYKHVIKDLTKAIIGLIVSITVVFTICQHDKIFELIKHYINL